MTDIARKRYDRIAWGFDYMEAFFRLVLGTEAETNLVKRARGKTLEVGVGTGVSLERYPEGTDLTGIDISPKMLERAKRKAADFPGRLELVVGDVQNLQFQDNTFDTIITSCVFCSVTDPVRGFEELKRVLKPDGELLMLEHVRSNIFPLGFIMDAMNPIINHLMGPNINRDTLGNIKKAGLHIVQEDDLWLDVLKYIIAKKRVDT